MMKRSTGDSGARSILIAHPSADLYGSDRVMLESITGLVSRGHRVVVTLPSAGALVREIEQRGAAVEFCASPVLRKSALRPVGFLQLVVETARSIPRSMSVIRRNGAEVVYVNTLMIQDTLAEAEWDGALTDEDRRGLNPLFTMHMTPYGEVRLNMTSRLNLSDPPTPPEPAEAA